MKRGELGVTMANPASYILPPVFFFPVLWHSCSPHPPPPHPQQSWVFNAIVREDLFIEERIAGKRATILQSPPRHHAITPSRHRLPVSTHLTRFLISLIFPSFIKIGI